MRLGRETLELHARDIETIPKLGFQRERNLGIDKRKREREKWFR